MKLNHYTVNSLIYTMNNVQFIN